MSDSDPECWLAVLVWNLMLATRLSAEWLLAFQSAFCVLYLLPLVSSHPAEVVGYQNASSGILLAECAVLASTAIPGATAAALVLSTSQQFTLHQAQISCLFTYLEHSGLYFVAPAFFLEGSWLFQACFVSAAVSS